jgi:phosphopantetheinyl transferase (holo-ACP synthase)
LSAEPGLSGVEVGLVSVPRFRRALDRFGPRLLHRIFSADEIAYAARKRDGAHNLAARFAAKCAGRRALARLGARPGRWLEIEVVRRRFTLSLTHDPDLAMASVFVWGEGSS